MQWVVIGALITATIYLFSYSPKTPMSNDEGI